MKATITAIDGKITEVEAPFVLHAVDGDGELFVQAEASDGKPLRVITLARDGWHSIDICDFSRDKGFMDECRRRQRTYVRE